MALCYTFTAEISTTATARVSNSKHILHPSLHLAVRHHKPRSNNTAHLYIIIHQESIFLLFSRNISYLSCKAVGEAFHLPSLLFFRDIWWFWKGKKWLWLTYKSHWEDIKIEKFTSNTGWGGTQSLFLSPSLAICTCSRVIKQHSSNVLAPNNDLTHYNYVVNKELCDASLHCINIIQYTKALKRHLSNTSWLNIKINVI